ncbi:nucleotidyltransferase family protein [Lysinibacillus sphaericus]|uniref:Nucleotidyltransferase family protein n=1 Tax=Lysinibacillus sphaericus TaxID=1421 RepID=A0A544ULB7_LYSSH|nr:nucleotidyltransferase family protein [Lysinibacillus sp. SDF0037]TQR34275.1 nucleotidyltransferase family protein [Lysinibacillus sp. SDF0037]
MKLIKTEQELKSLIAADKWMMNILKTVEKLQLPDSWVCAGFIRSKVWDYLHEKEYRTPLADIDVIYFDKVNLSENYEKQHEQELMKYLPNEPWSVKNQARMHVVNNSTPYQSSIDGMAHFPEIPTAIGVRFTNGILEIAAPHGIKHLVSGTVAPTPYFQKDSPMHEVYKSRIHNKQWKSIWPKLQIFY